MCRAMPHLYVVTNTKQHLADFEERSKCFSAIKNRGELNSQRSQYSIDAFLITPTIRNDSIAIERSERTFAWASGRVLL